MTSKQDEQIDTMIASAAKAFEREACAKMVADWDLTNWDQDCDFKDVLAAIAAAIRARGRT